MTVRALGLLIRRGLRRTPGQHLVVLALSVVAGLLLHLGLVVTLEFPRSFERSIERLNTEDSLTVVASAELADEAEQFLAGRPEVRARDVQPARGAFVTVSDYRGEDAVSYVVFTDADAPPSIGAGAVVAESPEQLPDGIYLPYQFAKGGGFDLGDPITLRVGSQETTFHVQGLVETPFTGSFSAGLVGFGLPRDTYARFAERTVAPSVWLVRMQVGDPAQARPTESALSDHLCRAGAAENPALLPISINRELTLPAIQLSATSFALTLVVFALIVTAVAVAVIAFSVRSAVVREMPALGTLKALGFTSAQVVCAIALQHVVSVGLGGLIGALVSYAVLPGLEDTMAAQTGLVWEPGLQPWAVLATVVTLAGAAGVSAAAAAARVRRLLPVDALRGGLTAHSFRRNPLPLGRTPGPLTLLLGLKQAARRPGQGAFVTLVLAAVTFTGVFCVAAAAFFRDPAALYDVAFGDMGDITISAAAQTDPEAFRRELAAIPGVASAYFEDPLLQATSPAGTLMVKAMEDFSVLRDDSVVTGRAPRYPNEVALGPRVMRETGIGIGDEITLGVGDRSATYLVTAISQSSYGLGRNGMLTSDGYRRLAPDYRPGTLRLIVEPGAHIDDVLATAPDRFPEESAVASDTMRRTMIGTLADALGVVVVLYLGVGALVSVLVVGLVVAGAILHGRREAGIQKALGYESGQLLRQLLVTQLPALVVGIALGLVAGWAGSEPLISSAAALAGLARYPMEVTPAHLFGVGAGMFVLVVLTIVILGQRLRSVETVELVRDAG
ncbi:ABC transporter permease [Ammonicoccus fulvus]|uniref:ABC transporter permease n=1 Tax=Ammonicoccus fulvus TaxID=3138240 RepID=A0ABZ3FJC7_9ACTN